MTESWTELHEERNALRKHVEELTQAEKERTSALLDTTEELEACEEQLAAEQQAKAWLKNEYTVQESKLICEQAYSQQLREALRGISSDNHHSRELRRIALSAPHDTTALDRSNKLYAAAVLERYIEIMLKAGCTRAVQKATQEAAQLRKEAGE